MTSRPDLAPADARPVSIESFLVKLEWLLLLSALVVAGWVYPLRLKDAWLIRLDDSLSGAGSLGGWLWRILQPFFTFELSPLELRGVLMAPLMLAFLALAAARKILSGERPAIPGHLTSPKWLSVPAFLVWALASGFWSPTPDIARDAAVWAAVFGLFFFGILLRGISLRERRQLATALVILGSGVLAVLFLQALPVFRSRPSLADPAPVNWIFQVMYQFTDSDRNLFGSLIGHNTAAASFVLMTCFPAFALLLAARTTFRRWLLGLYLASAIFGVLLLQSRSIWILGPLIALLALRSALRQAGFRMRRWALTLVLAAVAFSLLTQTINRPWNPFYSSSLTLKGRMQDLTPRGLELEARLRLAIIGVRLIPEHPFIGSGLYAFQYIYPERQGAYFFQHPASPLNQTVNRSNFAHNEYLQLLIDHGLIGLALAIWIIAELSRAGWRLRRGEANDARLLREAFGWSSLGLSLHALVDFPFHIPQLLLPGMLCMAAWATRREPVNHASAASLAALETDQQAGRSFRPKVFARLLGAMLLAGAIPFVSSWMFVSLQGDYAFNEGSALLTAGEKKQASQFYPFNESEAMLNAAMVSLQHALSLVPAEYQTPSKIVETKYGLGKIYEMRAAREAAASPSPGLPDSANAAASDRAKAVKAFYEALIWTAQTLKGLNYHFVYYLASLAEKELIKLEPGKGHEARQLGLLCQTLYYCPVFGEAAYDLDSALASAPGGSSSWIASVRKRVYADLDAAAPPSPAGDHLWVVGLRRKISLHMPDAFNRRYFFNANDWKRLGYFERAALYWDQIHEIDPNNAVWTAETIDSHLLAGKDVPAAKQMLDQLRASDINGYYNTGAILFDDALKKDYAKGRSDFRNISGGTSETLARLGALESEFIRRTPQESHPAWVIRPAAVPQSAWDRAAADYLPEILLAYFEDPASARAAFERRLQMPGPKPALRFYLTGARIGVALRDQPFARSNLDEAAKRAEGRWMMTEISQRVESAF